MEFWSWPPRFAEDYRPPAGQAHWFPKRETMPSAERDAAILERIRQVMRYCWDKAPFYRRKWSDAGIDPAAIRTLEDFENVPVVRKEELRLAQAEHPPFGDYACVDDSQVHHIHGTSGTTGRPTAFGVSLPDWRVIANEHARIMWGMGIRPSDTVFIGSFFSLYMGSWGVLIGAERLGARAFPFGAGAAGQTRRAIVWLREMRPTVFYGTPSYALHVAETAVGMGVDPRELGLRILFFSGEPGASIPSIREKIERTYGALVYDSGSMAEVSPWMNLGESTARVGMLCWQDVVYTEVCDPQTFRRVTYGAEGTPVYTTLERLSQPMVRLLSGDLTRWEAGPSPCGRTYPCLPKGVYGRIDEMFTIRGENVYPSAIDEVVTALAGYGGEHRIVITRQEAMDELAVRLEFDDATKAAGEHAIEALRRRAEEQLRTVLGVGARVTPVPPGTLERTEFKARRVIDDRDLWRKDRAMGGRR
ncbi:MAG TPA: phenylacetate--CoA ligase family protein [Candidatus Limnocylindria bacterium]|nr:phenylacetate--CoA ligase family protein [Candidatus Limnocylindria bacterium]